jgi:hypothetical protein
VGQFERIPKPEQKIDDLLSQDPATKISLCSNRNRVLVRSKMAVIDAVFLLDSSTISEPFSLKSEPIILLASSWGNKHRFFAQGSKSVRLWSTLLFGGAQFGVFKHHTIMSQEKLTEFICVFTGLCQSSINFSFLQFFIQSLTAYKKSDQRPTNRAQKNFSSEPTNLH